MEVSVFNVALLFVMVLLFVVMRFNRLANSKIAEQQATIRAFAQASIQNKLSIGNRIEETAQALKSKDVIIENNQRKLHENNMLILDQVEKRKHLERMLRVRKCGQCTLKDSCRKTFNSKGCRDTMRNSFEKSKEKAED